MFTIRLQTLNSCCPVRRPAQDSWSDGIGMCQPCNPIPLRAFHPNSTTGWSTADCPYSCSVGVPNVASNKNCLDPLDYALTFFGGWKAAGGLGPLFFGWVGANHLVNPRPYGRYISSWWGLQTNLELEGPTLYMFVFFMWPNHNPKNRWEILGLKWYKYKQSQIRLEVYGIVFSMV